MQDAKVKYAKDKKGRKVIVMNEIIFYGKRRLPWKDVKKYLKKYIGEIQRSDGTDPLLSALNYN